MDNNYIKRLIGRMSFKLASKMLDEFEKDLSKISIEDEKSMETLYAKLIKGLGISEHTQWRIKWEIKKWHDSARKVLGFEPDEVLVETQNIVLDLGANELLKLISGTGGTAYNSSNAYIYVGTDTTAEKATQTGVIATGDNKAYAALDSGYPLVNGRQVTWRATFGDETANFKWAELSVVNGTGANAVALNRKVREFGTKASGSWTVSVVLTINSNT